MIIITLTKNSEKFILKTSQSLSYQTFKNIHWIILDDNSNDNTLKIIKKSKIKKVEIIHGPDKGIFSAYNYILNNLKKRKLNDIIFFIHSDDILFDRNTLKNINDFFTKYNPDCLFGNIAYFKKNSSNLFRFWNAGYKKKQTLITDKFYKLDHFKYKDLLLGYSFPHVTFFFNSKIIKKIPMYPNKYPMCGDYYWSLETLLSKKIRFYFYDNFIIKMRYGGISTSYKNLIKQQYYDFMIIKDFFFKKHQSFFLCVVTFIFKKMRKIIQFF